MQTGSEEDIDKSTTNLFTRLYGHDISPDECLEIKDNFMSLIKLLQEINQDYEGGSHG